MIRFVLALLVLPLFHSASALAFPGNPNWGPLAATTVPPMPQGLVFRGGVDFTGIVALSNCSGSLVRFETSLGTDPAMVLTNGHCYEGGFLKPGEAKINVPSNRSFRLLRQDGSGAVGTLTASRVIYATMTGTDMTLYQLQQTYDQIEKGSGIHALTISSKHPVAGTPIAIASGYWRKIYNCGIDRFIYALREADWTFRDSIRYTPDCHTIHGTSGSPIIDASTHEIIGINNTGNDNGERCTMDNPCEVDQNGNVTVSIHISYGQETFWFYSCLGANNQLDFNRPGCILPHVAFWLGR